ncbi:raftlin-like isoform X2 [Lampris incognitus]|uniref:raftlin-like isoform X2 n=1 Tax=Lampris incognitus TaxID=2546036 RepID=UPI0024B5985A|nr:raftlin-like isoform X2 [Lampris incognitus]
MGCGLRKLKSVSEENSPGKIYSTLKRPQVETKVGVAYTYRYLDFLIGKDGGTSTLRLSSVRELPDQLQELYQQGFVLAAVHPFIHPCGPESNSPQHQLYRAILVRLNDGVESSHSACTPYRLQLEDCLSADQVPTPELIQGYVKKIQDAADQGVLFVGFIQEPYGAPCTRIREPETPSLSLHSSPSSVLGSLGSCSPSNPSSPNNHRDSEVRSEAMDITEDEAPCKAVEAAQDKQKELTENDARSEVEGSHDATSPAGPLMSDRDLEQELTEEDSLTHNNNKANTTEKKERSWFRTRRGDGVELLALFNHPEVREGHVKYYTVKVPLRVQNRDEGVKGVEANWLDHMTQHFNNGASLVDGYFNLGNENDLLPKSVESVFIFQEAAEAEPSAPTHTYDAIVVEQWTVIDGLQVKADYVPLLQSLATYGWRLTCVLPTPVIKTNSDGSLSTKQIVFLQRPVLARKKRESKKLIFKSRGKSNKNCIKDTTKNKKKKNKTTGVEKDPEDPKILDDREKVLKEEAESKDEGTKKAEIGTECKESEIAKEKDAKKDEDRKMVEEIKIGAMKDSDTESRDKGAVNSTADEGEEEKTPLEGERSIERAGALENGEIEDAAEAIEKQKESEAEDNERAGEIEVVGVENGVQRDEEKDEDKEDPRKQEEPITQVITEEIQDQTSAGI